MLKLYFSCFVVLTQQNVIIICIYRRRLHNTTDRHDITEILLKVVLNTTKQTNKHVGINLCLILFVSLIK